MLHSHKVVTTTVGGISGADLIAKAAYAQADAILRARRESANNVGLNWQLSVKPGSLVSSGFAVFGGDGTDNHANDAVRYAMAGIGQQRERPAAMMAHCAVVKGREVKPADFAAAVSGAPITPPVKDGTFDLAFALLKSLYKGPKILSYLAETQGISFAQLLRELVFLENLAFIEIVGACVATTKAGKHYYQYVLAGESQGDEGANGKAAEPLPCPPVTEYPLRVLGSAVAIASWATAAEIAKHAGMSERTAKASLLILYAHELVNKHNSETDHCEVWLPTDAGIARAKPEKLTRVSNMGDAVLALICGYDDGLTLIPICSKLNRTRPEVDNALTELVNEAYVQEHPALFGEPRYWQATPRGRRYLASRQGTAA